MQSVYGAVPSVARRLRHPVHNFELRHRPFVIQPFCIAPVLPGETMKNLSFQSRVVTRPIKNPLVGWWIEYYFFYVKHRDLDESSLWQSMVLDPGVSITSSVHYRTAVTDTVDTAACNHNFHVGTGIDWSSACYKVIIREFFRDEGITVSTVGGLELAQVNVNNWTDSLTLQSTQATFDVNVDQDTSGTIMASEVDRAMRTYELLAAGGLVNISYEDWLRSYGVRQANAVRNVPEVIRYVREWTYPSSHVDPVTGGASSAVSWSIAERADKDRFFSEPGWIYGVTVARPKIYFANLKQPGASLMDDAYTWLPAVLRDDAGASIKRVADTANDMFGGVMSGNWAVDVKDLLVYGDQWINFPLSTTDAAIVALPTSAASTRFVSSADIDALFVTAADAVSGVRQDGTVRLSILGTQSDTTPSGSTTGVVY